MKDKQPQVTSNWRNLKVNSWTPTESAEELARNGVTNPFGRNSQGQTVEEQILSVCMIPEISLDRLHIAYLIALQHHTPEKAREMVYGKRSKKKS